MRVFENIDLVQINLNNTDRKFYFPKNVNFKDKKINSLMLLASPSGNTLISPFDGKNIIANSLLDYFYINIYNEEQTILLQNVEAKNVDARNNYVIPINSKIDLVNTNIVYNGSASLTDTCILAYVSYGEKNVTDYEIAQNQLAVNISVTGDFAVLSDFVDEYFRSSGKKIKMIEAFYSAGNSFYLSLRDKLGRTFRYVPSAMMFANGQNHGRKTQPMAINDFDIDFKNSFIYNAENQNINVTLIFYF